MGCDNMTETANVNARRAELLRQMETLIAEIDAQERHIRRFRWHHPIKYWRWRKTPAGRQYKLMDDIESGKIPGIIS